MTYLVERLTELRRYLDHLRALNDLDPIERFLAIVAEIESA